MLFVEKVLIIFEIAHKACSILVLGAVSPKLGNRFVQTLIEEDLCGMPKEFEGGIRPVFD